LLGGESYSRVHYEEAILEICSRNRVGDPDFRSHLSKICLQKCYGPWLVQVQNHKLNYRQRTYRKFVELHDGQDNWQIRSNDVLTLSKSCTPVSATAAPNVPSGARLMQAVTSNPVGEISALFSNLEN
jgi:hypothetical protein